eukprot:scaffold288301_cov19-Tisochrysis_lutea.AAC.1
MQPPSIVQVGLAWGYDEEAVQTAVCKLLHKHPELDGPEDIGASFQEEFLDTLIGVPEDQGEAGGQDPDGGDQSGDQEEALCCEGDKSSDEGIE